MTAHKDTAVRLVFLLIVVAAAWAYAAAGAAMDRIDLRKLTDDDD